jgi:IclR family acetate operon transcriptional repressor
MAVQAATGARGETTATVDKALDVLFHLHAQATPQGVSAIARALGLPKSSAHRLLSALGRRGLVERTEASLYRPGFALIALGLGVLASEPVVAAARPVLEEHAREVGETHFLVAARAGELVVLDKVEGTGFLRAAPRVGAVVPAHATAVGKLYSAFAPEALDAEEQPLAAFTPRTLCDPRAFDAEVRRARRRGFAANREEWIPGLSVLAAPIRPGGRMAGAVAVAAATPRLEALGVPALAERLRAAGERIAARLEGRSQ